jgi:hypothetical protein
MMWFLQITEKKGRSQEKVLTSGSETLIDVSGDKSTAASEVGPSKLAKTREI